MRTRVYFLFPDELIARVRAAANSEGIGVGEWVRRVLQAYLGGECPNYDPYYGECRMADGSNPKCHPN